MKSIVFICRCALVMIVAVLSACGSEEVERHTEIPLMLSPDKLVLEQHAEGIIEATGAEPAEVLVVPEIATASVSGNKVLIHALEVGSATVTVRSADRKTASCALTVTERTLVPLLTDAQLADKMPRFESEAMSLRYGTPGIMYCTINAGSEIVLRNIDNAKETVSFMPEDKVLYIGGEKEQPALVKNTVIGSCVYYQIAVARSGEVVLFVCEAQ